MGTLKALGLAMLTIVGCSQAWAQVPARILSIPPINVGVMHGDIVCGQPAYELNPANCNQYLDFAGADLKAAGTEALATGVYSTRHFINFTMSNVSNVPQTVTVRLLNGNITSFWNLPGSTRQIDKVFGQTDVNFPLPPNANTLVSFEISCNVLASDCCLVTGGGGCLNMGGPTSQGAYGVSASSTWTFQVRIQEARGAVNAILNTSVHRGGGAKDKLTNDLQMPLNGGRPF